MDDAAIQIHLDQRVLGHETFGYACRCSPDDILVYLAGDIAVVGRDKILLIHAASNFQNHLLGFIICRVFPLSHRCLLTYQLV
ncbi:hypothetical protein SDC9_167459 [bioreactor metagenome]|uniref:Uncharacterized protein n=1 Tax=bioreactor metagenome TaxID=1076179 RepID=A0A645G2B6_9ZZZZ